MAIASTTKKGRKARQRRAGQAKNQLAVKSKARASRSTPLNAQRDATRKLEVTSKRRGTARHRRDIATSPSAGLELVELMKRRTNAFFELPIRLARCQSPFAMWGEHMRFMQGVFADYQSITNQMMRNTLGAVGKIGETHRAGGVP
jgi:hypothetical protein